MVSKSIIVIFVLVFAILGLFLGIAESTRKEIAANATNNGNQTESGNQTISTPELPSTVSISITSGSSSKTDTAFSPNPIALKVGGTATWTNDDSTPHTVTSGQNAQPDDKFNSSPNFTPLLTPGQTFSHQFTEAGEYPYYCQLHPNMVGTISVS